MRRRSIKEQQERQAEITRRQFLAKGMCAGMGVLSMASTIWDLRFMNAAMAVTPGPINDYKALVCVFLNGGNDANNMIVPTDSATYDGIYVPARGGVYNATTNPNTLAIPPAGTVDASSNNIGLLPLNPLTSDGHTYGLHPAMPELRNLYNSGKMAALLNVGTMVYPFQYGADSYFGRNGRTRVPQPYQLFSHSDQQIQWMTGVSDTPLSTGWGGRAADMINDAANSGSSVSMNISLAGQNTFEVGNNVTTYSITTSGAPSPTSSLGTGTTSQLQALNDLIGYRGARVVNGVNIAADPGWTAAYDTKTLHPNLYEQAYATTTRNGINSATVVNAVNNTLANTDPAFASLNTNYTGSASNTNISGFGQQLRSVAKMIAGRATFGHKRQIFFVQVGGYDLHSLQGSFSGAHANLLRDLSRGLGGFYDALAHANINVAPSVTAFTVSDFSRTFPINGGFGSDHGWGNHQLVVGGAVNGQKNYGALSNLTVSGTQDTGTGRWIPTTSCDEYFACLARWYGISPTDIAATVLPNIGHFANALDFV